MARDRLSLTASHLSKSYFSTVEIGSKYSSTYKNYLILPNGGIGSYFHDIPINLNLPNKTCNVVIEIPRWSNAKFEINKDLQYNPITQDLKNNKPRFVKNLYPFKGYPQNYGAIPQTWDDPTIVETNTGYKGDNDPIDIVEIGSRIAQTGEVIECKILGSLALIDDGELDWKVIAIDINDELVNNSKNNLNDIQDVETVCPGLLSNIKLWFQNYKKPDGKSENQFGFNGEYLNVDKTLEIIQHGHQSWKNLINDQLKNQNDKFPLIINTTQVGTKGFVTQLNKNDIIQGNIHEKDSEIPKDIEKSYYF
ncbi:hypothetical protein WICMUC_001209 [Wickerhamomyces mucosus]|uniref:inorganic diphosphatase n=1 Tax=Wickerhamomyces mucosus TaxID=1378264 RepID=A0A9P8PX83_9ASCO|nr:hypothetical protein WICMUC_001209 [Wickerhamomyces mucosus]